MYPENSGKSRKKMFIILAAIVVVLAAVVLALTITTSSPDTNGPKGTLEVNYNLSDTIGVTVKLNDKTQKTSTKYSLTPGKYTLKVTRPGYTTFTSSFTIKENSDVLVNVRIKPDSVPAVDKPETLAPLLPDTIKNPQVISAEYFYDHTWAVVIFNSDVDTGDVAVMRYIPENHEWLLINDPGVVVDAAEVGDAPEGVITYLESKNLIFYGD
jgi:hypothetical protein